MWGVRCRELHTYLANRSIWATSEISIGNCSSNVMVALLITDPIGAISTSLQNQPVSPQFKPTITITLNQFRWCHFTLAQKEYIGEGTGSELISLV